MGKTAAILVARLIFAAVFAMAAGFKFFDMHATAGYIAGAGFPLPLAHQVQQRKVDMADRRHQAAVNSHDQGDSAAGYAWHHVGRSHGHATQNHGGVLPQAGSRFVVVHK